MDESQVRDLHTIVAPFVEPALAGVVADLESSALGEAERGAVRAGLARALADTVVNKTVRLLLIEVNAARVGGALTAADPAARWREWVDLASAPDWWATVDERYPTFRARMRTLVERRRLAAVALGRRFAADRAAITALVAAGRARAGGGPEVWPAPAAGAVLESVSFGAGDSHHGHTVAIVELTGGVKVVYKPRPVEVDRALASFVRAVLPGEPEPTRIRVPEVVVREGYGWAEHVDHRLCTDDAELRSFYRGLGHWLAVTALLSASDLHSENLIAQGPAPVVVDCETFFTPAPPLEASGFGDATDRAIELLRGSPLRTGLLPGRAGGLGQRGADISAAGALPSEQPLAEVPTVVGLGTDSATVGTELIVRPMTRNRPSAEPRLRDHWPAVVAGHGELTAELRRLDAEGRLRPLLEPFRSCAVRVVVRDTVVYGELGAMLWHPAALHAEATAVERAASLLTAQAEHAVSAPSDPVAIAAEIADLLVGDVPVFTTIACDGVLVGPAGVRVGEPADLVAVALDRWRALDPAVEAQVIECTVVSAYRDEESAPAQEDLTPSATDHADLDRRRRGLMRELMGQLVDHAVRGPDGTATWTAPTLGAIGLMVQPLALDLYNGLPGIAMLLAAYGRETAAGRAEPVPGADELLAAVVSTIEMMDRRDRELRAEMPGARPDPPGGYVGIGSRVWGWLALGGLGVLTAGQAVERAASAAREVREAVDADEFHDLLIGIAGVVVPLVRLAEATGDGRWLDEAVAVGERLARIAVVTGSGARWPGLRAPGEAGGLGGFAHGSVGVAWALRRLADATGDARFAGLADAGLAFQESLWSDELDGWLDLRKPPGHIAANWCHGGDGVGIAAADLEDAHTAAPWRDVLRRAARSGWRHGFGDTHTVCHGDLGSWEVLDLALRHGVAPAGVTRRDVDARVLSSMEEFGPRVAMTARAFRPGLLSGMGGMVWQLLRMHPECALPSLLIPDPAAGRHG